MVKSKNGENEVSASWNSPYEKDKKSSYVSKNNTFIQ
jgi:hypothetical protein